MVSVLLASSRAIRVVALLLDSQPCGVVKVASQEHKHGEKLCSLLAWNSKLVGRYELGIPLCY